jgi:hypothetical protein
MKIRYPQSRSGHPRRALALVALVVGCLLLANLGLAGAMRKPPGPTRQTGAGRCDVADGKRASKSGVKGKSGARGSGSRERRARAARHCPIKHSPAVAPGPSSPVVAPGAADPPESGGNQHQPESSPPPGPVGPGQPEEPLGEGPSRPEEPAPEEPGGPTGPEEPAPEEPEEEEPAPEEPGEEEPAPEEPEEEEPAPEEPGEEEPVGTVAVPLRAQAEEFAGRPAGVELTFQVPVGPSDAAQCVGIESDGGTTDFGGVEQGSSSEAVQLELVPGGEMPAKIRCPGDDGATLLSVTAGSSSSGGVVDDPIDPKYLTQIPFGRRSFWVQPWRSYMDTWPASRLLNAVGINFNVRPSEAEGTAHLLQDSGFKLARVELNWSLLSYDNPSKFNAEPDVRTRLVALREHGLRPLILLNANSGSPGPSRLITLNTLEAAAAGATSVPLSADSAAQVVPGKTGFSALTFGGAPDLLIKSVDSDGVATLAKPLPAKLAAGDHPGATLRYAPFGPPQLPNGNPNPAFQATLTGWLNYVGTINDEAESVFGAGNYDFEVWNELSFGSEFLEQSRYYSPPRESGSGSVTEALLDATVAYLRDPRNGVSSRVGITDGFASQTPFASGGSVPVGTTALSKHLYSGPQYFPRNAVVNSIMPVDALGATDTTGSKAPYTPRFTPSFTAALPEYFLTATQTETAIRDLSPATTTIYGVPHGRAVGPEGGRPTQVWMTEYNLNTNTLFPLEEGNPDHYIGTASAAEKEDLQARIVLRSLVSLASKGMSRVYFYAAAHTEGYSLVSERFIKALSGSSPSYPGDSLGGPTTDAVRNLLAGFAGPGPSGGARQLELRSVAQQGNHAEFTGDGTAAHPSLYDRDLLAVFPFQSAPNKFVIPIYVMTPNLTTVYPGSDRFDLPDESFQITLGNLPTSVRPPAVSAYDPITNGQTPARFVSRQGGRAVFEVAATNYPRLLTIDYGS